MSPRNTIIYMNEVSKKFGKLIAVNEVSFRVMQGEVIGFVGPNGAGKSTAIGLLMGFLQPSQGEIFLFGDKILPQNAHTKHMFIGYTAGDMAMLDNLTGQQYLDHMAALTRPNKSRQKELIQLLEPTLDRRIKTLSRGNKQKVAIVSALQHRPKLLIMDEPTSGLDPLIQDVFLNLIELEAKEGMTVFMSSHILSEVADTCSRVLFMKTGKVILDSSIKDIEVQAGKEIIVKGSKATLASLVKKHPKGLQSPSIIDGNLRLLFRGDPNQIMQWLAGHKLQDVTVRDRDFDSIFHEMYKEDQPE